MTMLILFCFVSYTFACGGFFCSLQQPVVQEGENILFSMKGNQVRATIQIKYQGDADKFSWVLPLPSVPDFAVSSDRVFSVLHAETDPTFSMEIQAPKDCATVDTSLFCPIELLASAEFQDDSGGGPKVEVLKEGDIGPFTYKVIAARVEDKDGTDLFNWLNDEGYDQPEQAKPIVARYVKNRHRFVTLKLQKGKEVGELVPIVLEYESPSSTEMSCIPLRLTAIAASEDMPVFVWIAGKTRAVPNNFVHLVPDMSELPWKKCFSGVPGRQEFGSLSAFGNAGVCVEEYQQMLKDVAKEYGLGRWMTTEFAGKMEESMLDMIWNDEQPAFKEDELASASSPIDFLMKLINLLRPLNLHQSPQTQEFLKRVMPKPSNVRSECEGDAQFYGPWSGNTCIRDYVKNFDAKNTATLAKAELIQPLIDTRESLEQYPYLTRMFTAISPEFMDRDPIFRFAPEGGLPDVSNEHSVLLKLTTCPSNHNEPFDAVMVYPNGEEEIVKGVKKNGCDGPVFPDIEPPAIANATRKVELLQASGINDFAVTALENLEAAVELDATLKDDVVGLEIDENKCNAGSKGCECGRKSMCAEGLECQTVRFVEICDIPSAATKTSILSSAVMMTMFAIAAYV